MKDPHEVILSTSDAAVLRALLRQREKSPSRSHAAAEVDALLDSARIVAPVLVPSDRAAIGSTVTYVEEPGSVQRIVRLSAPRDADGRLDRLSVLSPAGLALLGRRPGSRVFGSLLNGWPFSVRVVAVAPAHAEAAFARRDGRTAAISA